MTVRRISFLIKHIKPKKECSNDNGTTAKICFPMLLWEILLVILNKVHPFNSYYFGIISHAKYIFIVHFIYKARLLF